MNVINCCVLCWIDYCRVFLYTQASVLGKITSKTNSVEMGIDNR